MMYHCVPSGSQLIAVFTYICLYSLLFIFKLYPMMLMFTERVVQLKQFSAIWVRVKGLTPGACGIVDV